MSLDDLDLETLFHVLEAAARKEVANEKAAERAAKRERGEGQYVLRAHELLGPSALAQALMRMDPKPLEMEEAPPEIQAIVLPFSGGDEGSGT